MRIAIGCDHRGVDFKNFIIKFLIEEGYNCQDFGTNSPEPMDYPDIARPLGEAVVRGEFERGILICNTGIGMSIAANKIKGVRAALCHNRFYAERARQHNDANIICLGTVMDEEAARETVNAFLNTAFEGGRHARRLDKVREIEESY